MARDRGGFEQVRRRDEQGRPLSLMNNPASARYRGGYHSMITRGLCPQCVEFGKCSVEKNGIERCQFFAETNHG